MAETFALGVVFKATLLPKQHHLDGIAEATPPRRDCLIPHRKPLDPLLN